MRALTNRRFRSLLLWIAGVPIAAVYVWRGLLQPLIFGTYLSDFQESYMRAAGRLVANSDPYDLCHTMGCLEPTGPQYVMPPLLAWLLQPLVGVNSQLVEVGVTIFLNACLALFLYSTIRALRIEDWQLAALLVLVALGFEPVMGNIDEGQINLVLLALSGLWFWSWMENRWWGGIPLAAAVALKIIQAPVALLAVWTRNWPMLAAAFVTGVGLWLLAAPNYLFEYLTSVLPAVSQGTGFFENHSPGGTITRLLAPDTFFGVDRGSPFAARIITAGIALAALLITLIVLRSPSRSLTGRALEAASVVAVTPILVSYSWGTHLVLLLLPMFVLITWGVKQKDWTVLALVLAGWLLIGPGHKELGVLLMSGNSDLALLRVLAEFGVVAIVAIWVASLLAVHRERLKQTESFDVLTAPQEGARVREPASNSRKVTPSSLSAEKSG